MKLYRRDGLQLKLQLPIERFNIIIIDSLTEHYIFAINYYKVGDRCS